MTAVEFFDPETIENVYACLAMAPERVIFLGPDSKEIAKHLAYYRRVFLDRGKEIEFIPKGVNRTKLKEAVAAIQSIVDSYEDCVFDITGGDEMYNLALGVVLAQNPEKNLQIRKVNLKTNTVYHCDTEGEADHLSAPPLTVEEYVRLRGGDVVYGNAESNATYRWDFSEEFQRDVQSVWRVCREDPRLYNTQIGVLEAAENVGTAEGLATEASIPQIEQWLSHPKRRGKYIFEPDVIAPLRQAELLMLCEEQGTTLRVRYKNPQVKRLLTKAGMALELAATLSARSITDHRGAPLFGDVLNGVLIDWDGVLHDEARQAAFDTENEVDLILLHSTVPVFVSCKNGFVSSDELYKLDSVSRRFGGKYAKRVLLATCVSEESDGGKYLRQRAKDMDVCLIESPEELSAELRKLLR